METQWNSTDKIQDGLQKLQKALRDNNRVDQMSRESQGFSISKIDNQTLNQLDQYTSLAPATDDKTWLPAVQIQCNNGYTIQYKDPSTGKIVYTSSLNLQSDTTSIKSEGILKSIADNTKRDGPTNGGLFSIMSKDGTREKFTIMDNASADRAREADIRREMSEKMNTKFSIENMDRETLQTLQQYVNIDSTSEKIRLTIKKPFIANVRGEDVNKDTDTYESGRTLTIPLNDTKSFKLSPGTPRDGGNKFILEDSNGAKQSIHLVKPLM